MKPITQTIAAGQYFLHDVAGIYVAAIECNGNLTLRTDKAELCEIRNGLTWYPEKPFEWVRFENETGVSITIKFQAGKDRLVDNSTALTIVPHDVTQGATSSPWVVQESQKDTLGGASQSVTSGTAVLLIAAGTVGKARNVVVTAVGGAVYLADDSGVGSGNGYKLADGATFSDDNYIGAVYAIAVSATATVVYGFTERA